MPKKEDQQELLMRSCRTGDFQSLKRALEAGAFPMLPNGIGETPLIIAARGGDDRCIETMIHEAADSINARTSLGMTALLFAVRFASLQSIEKLVDAGARIENTSFAIDAVARAIHQFTPDHLETLRRAGASPERLFEAFRRMTGGPPVWTRVRNPETKPLLEWFLQNDVEIEGFIARTGRWSDFEWFLSIATKRDSLSWALLYCCWSGAVFTSLGVKEVGGPSTMIGKLLMHRGYIGASSRVGHNGRPDTVGMARVRRLIEAGADPNTHDQCGESALMGAVLSDYPIFDYLLSRGANPNARCAHGMSPLVLAIISRDPLRRVTELLDHGADPLVRGPSEMSIREIAAEIRSRLGAQQRSDLVNELNRVIDLLPG